MIKRDLFSLKIVILWILRSYKNFISPLLPNACRFYPTCSDYMMEAVQEWGVLYGVYLGVKRLLKCHPFHPGGIDPVPMRKKKNILNNRREQ